MHPAPFTKMRFIYSENTGKWAIDFEFIKGLGGGGTTVDFPRRSFALEITVNKIHLGVDSINILLNGQFFPKQTVVFLKAHAKTCVCVVWCVVV